MKRKSMKDFIKENREELDKCILKACPGLKLNNAERQMWVLNDESLYLWARREGVNV